MKEIKWHHLGKSREGFTLLELVIGVALFTIALFGTMLIIGESLTLGTFSGNRAIAMNKARFVIEEIRRVADNPADSNSLTTVANTNWTNWASQNLNDPLETLASENITVTDLQGNPLVNNANPLPMRVAVNWTEKGKTTIYAVDTLVTKR